MAEIATIARPYAEALFKASLSDLEATTNWLEEIAEIAADNQVLQLAGNPKVTDEQVYQLLSSVAKNLKSDLAQNFVRALIENGRLVALPEIAHQFRVLKNTQGGTSDAVVGSAFSVDDASLAQLQGALEKRFGRKLNLSVKIQPELIGGIRVVVGDEVLDTSVKARLEQMKVALTA
jgi:F-type H+-transporting ATPase subunit delta